MNKPYQEIITALIDRMYRKKTSDTAKIILKAHFNQETSRRRITLEALGKLPELKKQVTRERARQIIANFIEKAFPAELHRLERGIAIDDPVTLADKADTIALRVLLETLIHEINTTKKPVFASKIQEKLIKDNIIEENIYLPIAAQLAEAFNIPTSFHIEEFNDHHIIFENDKNTTSYTKDIIQYARKSATNFGGLFSIEKLTNSSWNSEAPQLLRDEKKTIHHTYILDLISSEPDYLALAHQEFYAFTSKDERISSILKPIFSCYDTPLKTDRVIPAIKRGLKHIFKMSSNDRQSTYVSLLEKSDLAIDEFCIAKEFLKETSVGFRAPGNQLNEMLRNYQMTSIVSTQRQVLEVIRKNGAPLESMELGRRTKELVPIAYKATIHTYPTLYYKDGAGRRNDFYMPLDDNYSSPPTTIETTDKLAKKIDKIKQKIAALTNELESLDAYTNTVAKFRIEQSLLREYLILKSQSSEDHADPNIGSCMICRKTLPANMLIAAHVKPRAICTHEERADIDNIAMLQCATCDVLYENGYITIQDNGSITTDQLTQPITDLNKILNEIEGTTTKYVNGNTKRLSYLSYHRENTFRKNTNHQAANRIKPLT